MDEKKDHRDKFTGFQAFENTKNFRNDGKFSAFIDYIHSNNVFTFIMGCSQVMLGTGVVTIALLGFISPFWVSTLFSILASITITMGIYFCYTTLSARHSGVLLREAMKRIVEAQN